MGLTASAHATPIAYNIILEVETVAPWSDPAFQVGETYFGFFVVDDEILEEDGLNKSGELFDFVISIESYLWAMNFPSDFEGFRGPPDGLFAVSPGFDVVGGEIVNLRGGVFSSGDDRFVDFTAPYSPIIPPNRFSSVMEEGPDSTRPEGHILGSLRVSRIPEPSSLLLLGVAIAGVVFRRGRTP